MGLFRPIRLQHNWVMTTSFTCSTGLGDKLMPPLLPEMFRLLFARLREMERGRAVGHRWCREALKHREEPSYRPNSQQPGKDADVGLLQGFVETEEVASNSLRAVPAVRRMYIRPPPSMCMEAHFIPISSRAAVLGVSRLMMGIFDFLFCQGANKNSRARGYFSCCKMGRWWWWWGGWHVKKQA